MVLPDNLLYNTGTGLAIAFVATEAIDLCSAAYFCSKAKRIESESGRRLASSYVLNEAHYYARLPISKIVVAALQRHYSK